jgi:hypothetical protein
MAMRIIAAPPRLSSTDRFSLLRGGFVAVLLIVVGALLGWAMVATPIISQLTPGFRPTPIQVATAVLAWAFAIVVPAGFVILGVARAVGALELLAALRPTAATPRLAGQLDDVYQVATSLRLPDGRYIHELVLGPFGLAILGDTPPREATRVVGGRWEVRSRRGWQPIESPVERTSRDAERVKRWLGGEDQDFVVKVYAAVVTTDARATRSASCAVISPEAVPAWLASLPPQRGLTEGRREELEDLIRSVAPIGR